MGSRNQSIPSINTKTSANFEHPRSRPRRNKRLEPQTQVACEECHTRKVKCDGTRPSCGKCLSNGRICAYEVAAGLTRVQQMRQSLDALHLKVDSFSNLYSYLQKAHPSDAAVIVRRIRSGASIESVLEFVKDEQERISEVEHIPKPDAGRQVNQDSPLLENELLLIGSSEPTMSALHEGVNYFSTTLGAMFPIFTRKELDDALKDFTQLCSKDEQQCIEIKRQKIMYCELSAVCAVAFRSQGRSESKSFYELARHFMDDVLEEGPLSAMRVCALLGLYNMIAKSALAIRYTELGISLGCSNGLTPKKRPLEMEECEYIKYKKVFQALVTIRKSAIY